MTKHISHTCGTRSCRPPRYLSSSIQSQTSKFRKLKKHRKYCSGTSLLRVHRSLGKPKDFDDFVPPEQYVPVTQATQSAVEVRYVRQYPVSTAGDEYLETEQQLDTFFALARSSPITFLPDCRETGLMQRHATI